MMCVDGYVCSSVSGPLLTLGIQRITVLCEVCVVTWLSLADGSEVAASGLQERQRRLISGGQLSH